MNVVANDTKDAGVHVDFTSPATPATVRDWFAGRLANAGFTLKADGDDLVGTTDEKKPFRLQLAPDGDAAKGTIVIGT